MSWTSDQSAQAELLFGTVLLGDCIEALAAGELLLAAIDDDDERRYKIALRLCSLRARLDPFAAKAQLEALELPAEHHETADQIRAEIAFAVGDPETADQLLDRYSDSPAEPWQLLAAMTEIRGKNYTAAESLLTTFIDSTQNKELLAAALVYRMDLRGRRNDREGVAADQSALVELLGAASEVSRASVDLQASIASSAAGDFAMRHVFGQRALEARERLSAGVTVDQASLGPMPLHVHCAFKNLRNDIDRLTGELINIAGLHHRADQKGEAFATLYYAAELGRRLLPPAQSQRLGEALRAYIDLLGPEQTQRQQQYINERAQAFMQSMRPRKPGN